MSTDGTYVQIYMLERSALLVREADFVGLVPLGARHLAHAFGFYLNHRCSNSHNWSCRAVEAPHRAPKRGRS